MQQRQQPVLRLFRWCVLARCALMASMLALTLLTLDEPLPRVRLIGLLIFALLAAYLSSGWLEQRLGRWFLPLGLLVATLTPIAEKQLLLWRRLYMGRELAPNLLLLALTQPAPTVNGMVISVNAWIPFLFIPLILIAWQYGMRWMLAFCGLVVVAETGLSILLVPWDTDLLLTQLDGLVNQVLSCVMLGYVVVLLVQAEQRQQQALAVANTRLLRHAATLEQLTISHERNRLARELHDTLAHTLSAATVQLEASEALRTSDPARAQTLAAQTLTRLRSGLSETRRALTALRAAPLEDLGLMLALQQLAEDYAQRAAWQLTLELPATPPELPPALEQTLYRCAQEALSNIDRHAAAQAVALTLICQPGHVRLMIGDDGRGFEPATPAVQRFGLLGMRERVALHGGTLELTSQPDAGTRLEVRIDDYAVDL